MSETEQTELNVAEAASEEVPVKKVAKKKTARKAAKKATKKAAKKAASKTAKQVDDAGSPEPKLSEEELPKADGGVFSFSPDDEPEPVLDDELGQAAAAKSTVREDDKEDNASKDSGRDHNAGANPQRGDNQGGDARQHKRKNGGNQQRPKGSGNHPPQGGGKRGGGNDFQGKGRNNNFNKQQKQPNLGKQRKQKGNNKKKKRFGQSPDDSSQPLNIGELLNDEIFYNLEELSTLATENAESGKPAILLNTYLEKQTKDLIQSAKELGVSWNGPAVRHTIIDAIIEYFYQERISVEVEGLLEVDADDEFGIITYRHDNYRIKSQGAFVHPHFVETFGLKRGHIVRAQVHPRDPQGAETCPAVIKLHQIMEKPLGEEAYQIDPFEELVPYYPLERLLLETNNDNKWDNLSMRVVDLLTPIGLGQRGLIVAPPRTGKTVLMQGIANSIMVNKPDAHLIVLLIDERPEEVTDFKRQIHHGEVISSTFDEDAESHVHCAEMVIEKSRRMVEAGRDVIILLDSITRLARAYNTAMPNSGKILSGGVEANALQKPKRFFGSARNIEEEGGGSLTILATALVDTGSRMDEVIFEEFKGTGNMEIHLDRALVDKRIFPAINFEKSGTRKEELLYHPDEMSKIYSLRRAMKGVPSTEAMEMLINRIKKTRSNAEFLMGLNR